MSINREVMSQISIKCSGWFNTKRLTAVYTSHLYPHHTTGVIKYKDELIEKMGYEEKDCIVEVKWDLFGRYVWPNPVFYDSHQAELDHLKNWYIDRMNWLDTAFKAL